MTHGNNTWFLCFCVTVLPVTDLSPFHFTVLPVWLVLMSDIMKYNDNNEMYVLFIFCQIYIAQPVVSPFSCVFGGIFPTDSPEAAVTEPYTGAAVS